MLRLSRNSSKLRARFPIDRATLARELPFRFDMKRLSLAFLCVLAAAHHAQAQNYTVSGGGLLIPATGTGGGGTWPTALPPSPGSSSLVLPADATSITSVTLTGMSHSWVGDVQLVLRDPSGARHNLITRLAFTGSGFGSSNDFSAANLIEISDSGIPFGAPANPVAAGVYLPHSGTGGGVWPNGNAGVFNSTIATIPIVPGGTYTLEAYDWESGDPGAIASWSLNGKLLPAYNIDIDGPGAGGGVPSPAYGAAGVAGFWNGVGNAPVAAALLDTKGDASSVTIGGGVGSGAFNFNNALTTGDDELLLDDVADIGGVGASRVYTISGLNTGVHEVITYAWAPDDRISFITNVTVAGGAAGAQACGGAAWAGSHVQGVTYVRDTVLVTGGSITVTVATAAGFGSLNGFQVRQLDTNPGPQNYCVSALSMNTCLPAMTWSGAPSASASSGFTVAMVGADGSRIGGMFYALSSATIPFGTGTATLCTAAPRKRLFSPPTTTSGARGTCLGTISIDLAAFIAANPLTLGAPFSAGDTIYLQGWNRDNGNGSRNIATSDGLAVTFTP